MPPCSAPGSFWERGRSGFSTLTFQSPGNSGSPPGSPGPVTQAQSPARYCHLRQTSGRDELLIATLENQLSDLQRPSAAGKTGLCTKHLLFSRSLCKGRGGEWGEWRVTKLKTTESKPEHSGTRQALRKGLFKTSFSRIRRSRGSVVSVK